MPILLDFSGEEGGTPYCGRLLIAPRVEDYWALLTQWK